MNINSTHYRTIWLNSDDSVSIIDQEVLPFEFKIVTLKNCADFCRAIKTMQLRGAGLIGAAAAYGLFVSALDAPENSPQEYLRECAAALLSTRPTAKNLEWALNRMLAKFEPLKNKSEIVTAARAEACLIADEDAACCRKIGEHGAGLLRALHERTRRPVSILTHCNAGWLAFVDYGSALAPVYEAFDSGIPLHVYVDETRPRNQGASLTAWELANHGVPHTLVCDNTGGHLMQHHLVDIVITGADRVTRTGDAANKIGTYLKALAARDNNIPFYVAFPSSTFDWSIRDGIAGIPIEQRGMDEVKYVSGEYQGERISVRICPEETPAANYGFDVTPSRLVNGLITERGIIQASEDDILSCYPERR